MTMTLINLAVILAPSVAIAACIAIVVFRKGGPRDK
jgi:hypothetical protein